MQLQATYVLAECYYAMLSLCHDRCEQPTPFHIYYIKVCVRVQHILRQIELTAVGDVVICCSTQHCCFPGVRKRREKCIVVTAIILTILSRAVTAPNNHNCAESTILQFTMWWFSREIQCCT